MLPEFYKQIWIKSKNVTFHNFMVKLFNFVWIYELVYPQSYYKLFVQDKELEV